MAKKACLILVRADKGGHSVRASSSDKMRSTAKTADRPGAPASSEAGIGRALITTDLAGYVPPGLGPHDYVGFRVQDDTRSPYQFMQMPQGAEACALRVHTTPGRAYCPQPCVQRQSMLALCAAGVRPSASPPPSTMKISDRRGCTRCRSRRDLQCERSMRSSTASKAFGFSARAQPARPPTPAAAPNLARLVHTRLGFPADRRLSPRSAHPPACACVCCVRSRDTQATQAHRAAADYRLRRAAA